MDPTEESMQGRIRQLFEEINQFRSNPLAYLPHLQARIDMFGVDGYLYLRQNLAIKTKQGVNVIKALMKQIQGKQKPLPPLLWSKQLHSAAENTAMQLQRMNSTFRDGNVGEQTSKFCKWYGRVAESVQFGYYSARDLLLSMLVDDGVPLRGNRRNLLSQQFKYVGIGCQPHPTHEFVTVVMYASIVQVQMAKEQAKCDCQCTLF